ncbi:MAG: glycerol-3-phosphate 1-O-acyltransferase PlsY [Paracoccaceae bacterium]|nr:glycerol-3-phosphate 1-O-acyltransferase PlsY [Paracoccaceae bacterium]
MLPDLIRFWGASPSSGAALPWVGLVFIVSYLFGSIPSGVLVTKAFGLGNLKSIGSGNIGATNVLRTGSKKAALLTLFLDTSKGILAVVLTEKYLGITAAHFAALGVFFGHLFSIFLFFKGGKGVATFLGILLVLNIYLMVTVASVWLITAWKFKYSSLASLVSSSLSIIIILLLEDLSFMWLLISMVLLIWFRHRKNVMRLLTGKESKINI